MLTDKIDELILRAQDGDASGIGEIYEHFYLSIYRYLYYKVSDPHTAEDLTSDVFLRMIRSLPSYEKTKVSFEAWLFRIAHNLSIDHYRKMSLRDHLPLDENMEAPEESVEKLSERGFNTEGLRAALKKLPDDQRDVIIMRFISGMQINEVAQTLEKSEDSIKGLQRRGLFTLRHILSDWEVDYA